MLSLKLNSKFYSQEALDRSVKDYSELGKVRCFLEKGNFTVIFDKVKPEHEQIIADEFKNYALAQMIKNK